MGGELSHRLRSVSGAVSVAAAGLIWLLLLGPVVELVTHSSLGVLRSALTAPGALDPLVTSVESGLLTLVVLVVCGTPLGWALARGSLPAPRLWEAGLLASLLLPPLVIGLLLVFLVGPVTPIGRMLSFMHASATNTFLALVIAQVYESAPYYVLGAQAAFADVDPQLVQQAALLGDPPLRAVRRVMLPLAAPGLAMALAVAWARAMGAFGAVVIVAYHPYGLPLQIWTTLQETGLASALPFALVLLLVALPLPLTAYLWSARARGRRRG
ncbi:ABC transporter permease subunit [Mycobacterium sp. SM1]|uniref:ABC transporter permease subunit n=1 Tax=Mycobacterium sp. SM1 TaxID=2816243 RepID=UPI001BD0C130|nr:ABC transporter permease subunit [Mycobacterium sp. SM1]MBS4728197.1 ABC transporter permease subunit [Mycobacterium sp. SM1]